MSEGPNYHMFRMAVDQVATLFCKTCGFACEIQGCPADKDNCPFHDKWVAIYDDLDQLIARVTDWKEVPRDDA